MQTTLPLAELFEEDEAAWLDAMVELIDARSFGDLDFANLREYLVSMGNRDRREVESRLTVLLAHVLKWEFQPEKRSTSWRHSINVQRRDLRKIAGKGVLRKYALEVLPEAYLHAVDQVTAETHLLEVDLPRESPYSFDELLGFEPMLDEPAS